MNEAGSGTNRLLITVSVMIPTLIEILDTSVANVALPHIQGSMSAGQEEITWVLTSYLVANAIIIPMSGWFARILGRKNYLLLSISIFTLSSMLCGMATSFPALVLFRVIQGLGGGGLQPMSQAILLETYPREKRGQALAIFSMGAITGPILGPLLGGWLTDNWSWRWIFYINIPIGLLALFMNWSFVSDPDYQERFKKGESVDWLGITLLTLGLGCLQIVLDQGQQDDWFNSTFICVLAVVAAVCLISLILWERRCPNPILDLSIFRNRSFAIGNSVMFFGFFAFFGSIVLLPLFLQNLMGYTAFLAGVVLGPAALISMFILPFVGKLTEKIDSRFLLAIGLLVNAYALHVMAGFNLQIDLYAALMSRAIQAFGIAFFFVPLSYLTMCRVRRIHMNNASGIFNLLRNLGGSAGTAFVTTMVARRAQFHQNRLFEHLSPYDLPFSISLDRLKDYLRGYMGNSVDLDLAASARIYNELIRQATALAFNDAFYVQSVLFIILTFVIWVMERPPVGVQAEPPAH